MPGTPANPYANGISIPGVGPNNSSATFNPTYNSALGTWGISQGANGFAPIWSNAQFQSMLQNPANTNGESYGGQLSGMPNESWSYGSGGGSDNNYTGPSSLSLDITNKGGGNTSVGYTQDPKTGYWIPSSTAGVGQNSWWQGTGIPALGISAMAAAVGAPELIGALGGAGAAGGTAAAGGIGDLAGAFAGAQAGADATLGAAGMGSIDIAGAGAAAGGAGMSQGSLSSLWGSSGLGGSPGMSTGGLSSFDPGYTSMINGTANAGTDASTMGYGAPGSGFDTSLGSAGSGGMSGLGQLGSGIQSLLGQNGLGGLYNTWKGNQLNQTTANNLMAMYGNAGAMAQPSVQATNQAISNPNSYFSSPLYQSQAALYGNNVDAQKNAAGTAGNGIDYTQKMMGFAGQNYDNYVNTIGGQAQGFLGNQAKYGQDYAFGQGLSALSQGAEQNNLASGISNNGGSILSGLGNVASGINSLSGGAIGSGISSLFSSIF